MFRNTLFFTSKKQVAISFLLLFTLSCHQKTVCNGQELQPLMGITYNPEPLKAVAGSLNGVTDSINGLTSTIKNTELTANALFSQINFPRSLSFLTIYGASFCLIRAGVSTIEKETKRNNDVLRKDRVAIGAGMLGGGLVLLFANKNINDFIFG